MLPYSSGTTGLPKGVMLTHRNLVANILQCDGLLPIEPDDVLIGVLPFFHIYGMTVIMNMGLRDGATIVTMPRFDLGEFLSLIEKHSVTAAYVVPPIALALAKHPMIDEHDLSSLRMHDVRRRAARPGADRAGREPPRRPRHPGLRDDRAEPGHPPLPARPDQAGLDRPAGCPAPRRGSSTPRAARTSPRASAASSGCAGRR